MENCERAADRVDYQVTIKRSTVPRKFSYGELSGPLIDCAYNKGKYSLGGWSDFPSSDMSEEEWIQWYFMMALQEAVHETCEWFQVDGKSLLDPHQIANKIDVRAAVVKLADELKYITEKNGNDHE